MAEEAATVPYIKVRVRERDCDPEGDAAGMRAELKSTDSCNSELSHLSRENQNPEPQYRGCDKETFNNLSEQM